MMAELRHWGGSGGSKPPLPAGLGPDVSPRHFRCTGNVSSALKFARVSVESAYFCSLLQKWNTGGLGKPCLTDIKALAFLSRCNLLRRVLWLRQWFPQLNTYACPPITSYSPDNQADVIVKFATTYNFSIIKTYADAGRSGLRLKNRPALKQLLKDVVAGDLQFRAILVYDVSRWGRFQD